MPSTKQRIKAVRGEVINFLSFLSVVWTLWEDEKSHMATLFVLTGVIILVIDCYFIRCQWKLQSHRALLGTRCKMTSLDDLMSDLPQTIWVLAYVINFKFSLIAIVCALHSGFSILEDVCGMQDEEANKASDYEEEEMERLND